MSGWLYLNPSVWSTFTYFLLCFNSTDTQEGLAQSIKVLPDVESNKGFSNDLNNLIPCKNWHKYLFKNQVSDSLLFIDLWYYKWLSPLGQALSFSPSMYMWCLFIYQMFKKYVLNEPTQPTICAKWMNDSACILVQVTPIHILLQGEKTSEDHHITLRMKIRLELCI